DRRRRSPDRRADVRRQKPCIGRVVELFWTCGNFPEVLMTHRYMKIGISVLVLVLAFTGLLLATLKDGVEAFKEVDEVLASPSDWSGKKFQVHGFVVTDSIMVKPDTLEYRFKVQNNGKTIDATYKG